MCTGKGMVVGYYMSENHEYLYNCEEMCSYKIKQNTKNIKKDHEFFIISSRFGKILIVTVAHTPSLL